MSKNILIYDIASLPKGKRMLDIKKEFEENNIVMWCSHSFGNMSGKNIENPPIVLDKKTLEKAEGIKFIDTSEV
jgi:hypothetical protein